MIQKLGRSLRKKKTMMRSNGAGVEPKFLQDGRLHLPGRTCIIDAGAAIQVQCLSSRDGEEYGT
jgi:hypothetical protein